MLPDFMAMMGAEVRDIVRDTVGRHATVADVAPVLAGDPIPL